jgi:small-conductance mechanosensitive channel
MFAEPWEIWQPETIIQLVGVIALLILIPIINKGFSKLYTAFENWCQTRIRVIRIHNMEFVLPERLSRSFVLVVKFLRSIINILVASTCLILLISIFPATHGVVQILAEHMISVLTVIWEAFLNFLPNLLTLIIIFILARYTLKLLSFLSNGIKQNKIRVSGVHPELITPTFQLLRLLVVGFALVAAYPYIPGSDSPVFRGLTIFAGFLLSLGSTSLVANVMAGVVLTYTRGLKIGDRVEIADAVGDVVDRNLLVTRIRTIKNVIITIPNSMVLSNHIINYSATVQARSLILHTTVTIGYDVPWRHVHQLLCDAATATPGLLKKPTPFVLQTSLDDFYVSYELNAYTKEPWRMADIYSELHQNIQDKFNEAGVEIMSPAYTAWRDGNQPTTSLEYQSLGYLSNFFKRMSSEQTRPLRW